MDPHLESIPCLASLTTRCLPGGDLQNLGWETNRSLDAEILALRTLDELLADLFERLHLTRGQGDADLVDFLKYLILVTVKIGKPQRDERTHGAFAKVLFGLLV